VAIKQTNKPANKTKANQRGGKKAQNQKKKENEKKRKSKVVTFKQIKVKSIQNSNNILPVPKIKKRLFPRYLKGVAS